MNPRIVPSSYRILHVIGNLIFSTKLFRIAFALSVLDINAAPIPNMVEYGWGQPMFTSIADTSFSTIFASLTARSASAVPIWKTKRLFSSGLVRKTK